MFYIFYGPVPILAIRITSYVPLIAGCIGEKSVVK